MKAAEPLPWFRDLLGKLSSFGESLQWLEILVELAETEVPYSVEISFCKWKRYKMPDEHARICSTRQALSEMVTAALYKLKMARAYMTDVAQGKRQGEIQQAKAAVEKCTREYEAIKARLSAHQQNHGC